MACTTLLGHYGNTLSPEKKAECLEKHATLLLPTVAAAEEQPATLSQTINAAAESLVTLGVSETTEVQSSSELNSILR